MSAPPYVLIDWLPSSYTGWGLYALNLILQWAGDDRWLPLVTTRVDPSEIVIDGLRRRRIEPCLLESMQFVQDTLRPNYGNGLTFDNPVLHAQGNHFAPSRGQHGVVLRGRPNIGITFFENTSFPSEACRDAREYELIVAGSRWNEE